MDKQPAAGSRAGANRYLAVAFATLTLLLGSDAAWGVGERREPVIPAGREKQVLELFRPYTPGTEIVPEHRFGDVKIRAREIQVEVNVPGHESPVLILRHRSAQNASDHSTTPNFLMIPNRSSPALEKLMAAVRANDRGGIWLSAPDAAPLPSSNSGGPEQHHFAYVLGGQAALLTLGLLLLMGLRRRDDETRPAGHNDEAPR